MRHKTMPQSPPNRGGFTLREVLVVVAVLSVLMAILVPAVLYARESSRRTTCANKVKQIGTALSSYESSHKAFPAASKAGFGPLVQLLPFLEQSALYDRIEFVLPQPDGAEWNRIEKMLAEHRPSVFVCPSESNVTHHTHAASPSYVANGGTSFADFAGNLPMNARPDNGAYSFGLDVRLTTSAFTDGLSNTAFYSEATFDDVVYLTYPRPETAAQWNQNLSVCRNAVALRLKKRKWNHANCWYRPELGASAYVHADSPNSNSCSFGGRTPYSAYSASSQHRNGVHVLFGDGRLEFVSDSIDLRVWRAIGTRNGAEGVTFD